MTTALYRRYRPESFAEVIGQEQVTGPLSIALTKNRVNHAYLFSGPRGCGKTTSARILARCLNCADGPTPTPCGVCPSCVELARGGPGSLDVVEIDAASHGGVDDARDLRERAAFAPVRDRFKVFIIDEAHMVSPQGFNALLKIVEEPPEHIRFIFATTEPEKVIGTIRSRTHHYPFRLVPPERLTSYLAELCEREGVEAGKGVLPLVVRSGGGSVRDSLSVLDQLIGGAGDEGLTYATAVALLGYTDIALLDDVTDALAAGDGATVFRVVDRVIESGHDPRRFVEDLLERMRDLLVVAALRDGGHAVFRGLPDDQLERMRSQAQRFGAAELSRAADVTNAALTDMTGATSPRLQLELLCARLLLPSMEEGERGLAARLDRLEKRINVAGGLAAAPTAAPVHAAPVHTAPAHTAPAQTAPAYSAPAQVSPAPTAAPAAAAPAAGSAAWPEPSGPQTPGRPAQPQPAAPAPAPATQPVAPAPAPSSAGGGDLEAVRRMWTEVMNALASIKRTTWSLVSQYAQVLDYDGKRLLLGFDSAGRAQSFGRGAHPDFLRQALIDVIGLDCTVEAIASADFRGGSAGPGQGGQGGQGGSRQAPVTAPEAAPARPPVSSPPSPPPAASAASAPVASATQQQAPQQQAPQQSAPQPPSQQQAPQQSAPHWTSPQAAPTAPAPRPARSPSAPEQRPPSGRPTGGRRPPTPASPYDDIPPSLDEPPPPEDELPPDDGRPAPNAWPKATRPPSPAAAPVPPRPEPTPARPVRAEPPAPAPAPAPVSAAPSSTPPVAEPAPAAPRTPPQVVNLVDDAPSADDADYEGYEGSAADFEGSTLVGAQVVQDVLGGRVIEEGR